MTPRIALLGFGEAAQAFVEGWKNAGFSFSITAYDIKTTDMSPIVSNAKRRDYVAAGVFGVSDLAELFANSNICLCLVTADLAGKAAQNAAQFIKPGTFYFDANSCAPETKVANAALINGAGGRYIDMAIMAPVHPKRIKTPSLLSGPDAEEAQAILAAIGMNAKVEAGKVGQASAIKMIRSIMIKGMESLTAECALAARAAGVETQVFDSLNASWQDVNWRTRASYNLERMIVHGERRAAEMREVVKTIQALGLDSGMSKATIDWQQRIGELALDGGNDNLNARSDMILTALKKQGDGKP